MGFDEKKTEIETLVYRKKKLDAKYKAIKNLVSGSRRSYLNDIATKTGNISKKKLEEMTDGIICGIRDYRAYGKYLEGEFKKDLEGLELSLKDRDFYTAYIYLILGFATYDNTGFYTRYGTPGTWDAVFDRLKEDVGYTGLHEIDRDMLLYDLYNESGSEAGIAISWNHIPDGIFYDMACAFKDITGSSWKDIITNSDRKKAESCMSDEEAYYISHPDKYIKDCRAEEEMIASEYAGSLIIPDEEIAEEHERLDKWFAGLDDYQRGLLIYDHDPLDDFSEPPASELGVSANNWKKFFTDKDRFIEACKKVRKLYCEIKEDADIEAETRMGIELYLNRQGMATWTDDTSYFTAYAYMNKALKASQKAMTKDDPSDRGRD